jgi:hypothetical protein
MKDTQTDRTQMSTRAMTTAAAKYYDTDDVDDDNTNNNSCFQLRRCSCQR